MAIADPNRYRYIADATRELLTASGSPESHSVQDLARRAGIACSALSVLLDKDPGFQADLNQWRTSAANTVADREAMQRDLVLFATFFLRAEKDALQRIGHDPQSVELILQLAASCADSVAGTLDSEHIVANIANLRKACCDAAQELSRQDSAKARGRWYHRICFGMAGVSVITADLVIALPTGGVSAGSLILGDKMLDRALD